MDKSKGGKKTKSTIATKEEIPIKKTKAKPVEVKPVEVKPVEVKPVEVKPIKVKKTKAKPVDVKPIKVKKTKDKPVEKVKEESKPEDFDTSGYFRLDDDGVELLKQILLNRGTNNNIKVTKDGVTNENVDIGELFNTIFNNKGTTNTFVNEAPKKKKKKKSKSEIQPNTVEENFTINYFSKSKDVKIAGLFNRWEPEPMIKGKDNEWSYTKKFRNGIYKFNFIVDGIWCHDDRYSTDERDEFHFSDDSDNEIECIEIYTKKNKLLYLDNKNNVIESENTSDGVVFGILTKIDEKYSTIIHDYQHFTVMKDIKCPETNTDLKLCVLSDKVFDSNLKHVGKITKNNNNTFKIIFKKK